MTYLAPSHTAPRYAPTFVDATGRSRRVLALTIWQPWASLLALGIKDVENREWLPDAQNDLARGDYVLLHAGKTFDADSWDAAEDLVAHLGLSDRAPWLAPVARKIAEGAGIADRKLRAQVMRRAEELAREAAPHSAILGAARYAGVFEVGRHASPWFVGPTGWRLVEPLAFDPVPCNGAPGLFAPDRATFATVSARWTEARFG